MVRLGMLSRAGARALWFPLGGLACAAIAAVFGACSSDGAGAGGGGEAEGADAAADAPSYPPLPPYVPDETPLPADYSIYDHGKDCYDRFLVEVPSFDCDGPDASRVKVEVNGAEVTTTEPASCDKPSLVGTDFACVPGARLTKLETVNKYGHTIATVILCRRSTPSAIDSGKYDNIAILQSDLQNAESCWFQIRKPTSYVARGVPSPYAPGRVKGDAADKKAVATWESPVTLTTDDSECYRCHDSQVWLGTPWIGVKNQVPSTSGKTHAIPRTVAPPTFLGKAYRRWNLAASRPKQVRIDAAAYDAANPLSAADAQAIRGGTMAPSDACTQCHSLGKSSLATAGQGTCNHFVRWWTTGKPSGYSGSVLGSKVSPFGHQFPRDAWMPPALPAAATSDASYQAFYRRAFEAVDRCCTDPSRAGCAR